jgi:hydroxymethylpyrimidine/phosphomethylpyrimidine kinase
MGSDISALSRPPSRSTARPPIVLAFAASDPTGGAGLQADVLTIAAMGCHPLSVLTGFTVQDTSGVHSLVPLEARHIEEQARRLLADVRVDAFKLGVLGSAQNVAAIAGVLAAFPDVPVVCDPVLASGRGDPFADDALISALCESILPQSTVVTPNGVEARRLAGERDLAACARRLLSMGAEYVLVTGGHEGGEEVLNTVYDGGGVVREDRWPRLPGGYHGSGCTLASALASALASGASVPEAARDAQEFTWQALSAGFAAGAGQLIPNRFFEQ